ncbi:MAG: phosphatase PAP2 family protein [Chloroflexi bacterium]|nr:phosphatase PAP2 family protein [Chloroflexota bacterium]
MSALVPSRSRLYLAMERLLLVYLAAIALIMVLGGYRMTPDVFFVFAGIAALLMGRGFAFVRDWFPLVAIFLAWQTMRGIAWQAGFTVQSDALIAVERAIHLGAVPTVVLQDALRGPGISPLDVFLATVYHAHFLLPLALGFLLWLSSRRLFYRYMAVLLVVSIVQFVVALLMPAAPPRFAYQFGEDLGVADVSLEVTQAFGWGGLSWAYANMIGNPYAAFPSLHAAYPVIALLTGRQRWPWLTWPFVIYTATVWFAIAYLGHHYLIDAYAGALLALGVWWAIGRWFIRDTPHPR